MLPFGAKVPVLMGLSRAGKAPALVKKGEVLSASINSLSLFGTQVFATFSGNDFIGRLVGVGGSGKSGFNRALELTNVYVKASDSERKRLLRKLEAEERWEASAVADRARAKREREAAANAAAAAAEPRVTRSRGGAAPAKKKKASPKKKRKRDVGARGFATQFERCLDIWCHYPTLYLHAPAGTSLEDAIFAGTYTAEIRPLTPFPSNRPRLTMEGLFGACAKPPSALEGGVSGHLVQTEAKLERWRGQP